MIWVDLVVLGIIVIFALIGYYKGLVYSVLSLASFFVSIILAKIISEPFTNYILKDLFKIDEWFSNVFRFYLEENKESNFITASLNGAAESMAEGIVNLIGIIFIFFMISIVFKIIIKMLDAIINAIPVVKELNTIGGFIFGFAKGLLIIWIIMGVLELTVAMPTTQNIISSISDSMFAKYLYYNNLLFTWLLPNLNIKVS